MCFLRINEDWIDVNKGHAMGESRTTRKVSSREQLEQAKATIGSDPNVTIDMASVVDIAFVSNYDLFAGRPLLFLRLQHGETVRVWTTEGSLLAMLRQICVHQIQLQGEEFDLDVPQDGWGNQVPDMLRLLEEYYLSALAGNQGDVASTDVFQLEEEDESHEVLQIWGVSGDLHCLLVLWAFGAFDPPLDSDSDS